MILKDEERVGKIQDSGGKIEEMAHTHDIYSGRSEKNRDLYDLQRGIQSHNSRNGQHRAVRIRTNVQHCPVLFMLETLAGRSDLLCLWRFFVNDLKTKQ